MNRTERIKQKLAVLQPTFLEVINDSQAHAGHLNTNTEEETHFTIKIAAASFIGKSLLSKHQMVNKLLEDEFSQGLHALSLKIVEQKNENI